ncbi:MAG: cytochrome P450, partial [Terriglobus roseus]|nr:cytochrome P450 [Terriglobus roseus]
VTVHATPYLLHRDPVAFPDAEEWLPDRWLDEPEGKEGLKAPSGARQSLMTFCTGPRVCIGTSFAITGTSQSLSCSTVPQTGVSA